MRIAVVGAGAVGGTLAALLDRAGHEVEVTARGDHLTAIAGSGLRLTGDFGDHTAAVRAGTSLSATPDLAIVATKAQDAASAIAASATALAGVPAVVVQNGLAGLNAARAVLGGESDGAVLGALALFAASHLEPGLVNVTARGSMIIGSDRAVRDLPFVAGIVNDAMPVTVTHDFVGAQWSKLVVNQVNALPAITGLSVQQVIAHPELRRILAAGMRETVAVARASGVRFAPLQGITDRRLRVLARLPLRAMEQLPLAMAKRMGDIANPGSTLQSIRRGRLTEVDDLNGAVVSAAHRIGMDAPVNAALVAMVHGVETTGEFLAPDEVTRRLPVRGRTAAR